MEYLKTLLSHHSNKAWIAGLAVVVSAYLIPILEEWFATVTPDQVSTWLGGQIPLGVAAVLLGLVSVIWVYSVKNKPPENIPPSPTPPAVRSAKSSGQR